MSERMKKMRSSGIRLAPELQGTCRLLQVLGTPLSLKKSGERKEGTLFATLIGRRSRQER